MARFDVDGSTTTYHPAEIEPIQPERRPTNAGSSTRSAYWTYRLTWRGDTPAAALEEWAAFDDGAQHSIVLPPPDDVVGSDDTYSNVYIEIEAWPAYMSVNVGGFSVLVKPIEYT